MESSLKAKLPAHRSCIITSSSRTPDKIIAFSWVDFSHCTAAHCGLGSPADGVRKNMYFYGSEYLLALQFHSSFTTAPIVIIIISRAPATQTVPRYSFKILTDSVYTAERYDCVLLIRIGNELTPVAISLLLLLLLLELLLLVPVVIVVIIVISRAYALRGLFVR